MKKTLFFALLIFYFLLIITPVVHADYVLPYPSYMPGNKLYAFSRITDNLKGYWYWGNIASFRYHLGLSDKYLVEAKTLFEYKQYLLAVNALTATNDHFRKLPVYLKRAKTQGKDITRLQATAAEAVGAHAGVLEEITAKVPEEFLWQPEKESPTELRLGSRLREAQNLRQTVGEIITSL